jgi:RNA polymerase sigma-70 factor (ECF subfamily)
MPNSHLLGNEPGPFPSTSWTVVLTAGDQGSPEARQALETLSRTYWYPIYAFIRRWGHTPGDAEDLTQEFFTLLLVRNDLARVDPARGRFRAFLRKACHNFLLNRRRHDAAHPRPLAVDFSAAENRYLRELSDDATPERIFNRTWALTLLGRVLAQVEGEMTRRGRKPLFDRLRPALIGCSDELTYAEIGAALGMTATAVRVAAHRFRKRFRMLLRAEIGRTVTASHEVEEEIWDLFSMLGA